MQKKLIITIALVVALAGVGVLVYQQLVLNQKVSYSEARLIEIAQEKEKACKDDICLHAATRIPLPGFFRYYTCGNSCVRCCAASDFLESKISADTYRTLLARFARKDRKNDRFQNCMDSKVGELLEQSPSESDSSTKGEVRKAKLECKIRGLIP